MLVPEELRYTSEHEWVRLEAGLAKVGITDYAQDALGDVVYVQLPTVGDELVAGATLGEVESTKSVSEIYAPLSGTVSAVNELLAERPELLNQDPYGEGWICELSVGDETAVAGLLEAAAYGELTAS